MARTLAELPAGTRLTDCISLGVLTKWFPMLTIRRILEETGATSQRQRDLPGHVVVYYVIALALYMQVSSREVLRCLLEGLQWLRGPDRPIHITGKSGISQARTRLGWEPVARLYHTVAQPLATQDTRGAWYRKWRVMSLDGSTLEVADTRANEAAFGRPPASRGRGAYPQVRLVALVETGTHVFLGAQIGPYHTGEVTLARQVLAYLQKGMLCLADRNFLSYALWQHALASGADLVWRVKKNLCLPVIERWADGSYLSVVYPTPKDRRHATRGIRVRVIEYRLAGVPGAEPLYRLVTSILDPQAAPASELAALYQERWEIETALDEFKTHLRGARIILRSKTPNLVRQECYGLFLAHYAIRGVMHEAAVSTDRDPDTLSFVHAVRVIRRKLPLFSAFPPSGVAPVSRGRPQGNRG